MNDLSKMEYATRNIFELTMSMRLLVQISKFLKFSTFNDITMYSVHFLEFSLKVLDFFAQNCANNLDMTTSLIYDLHFLFRQIIFCSLDHCLNII